MNPTASSLQILASLSVFKDLPAADLELLHKRAQRRTYHANDTIYREGDPAAFIYLVVSGEVQISLSSEERRISIGTAPAGKLVGLHATFDDGPQFLAATATAPTSVLAVPKQELLEVVKRNPSVMFKLAQILARQSRLAAFLIAEVQFLDLPVRLAKRLLELADRNGEATGGGPIDVKITQKDLSELAGATRGGVNRALKRLEDLGVIDTGRGRLRILSVQRLRDLAGQQESLPAALGLEPIDG